MIVTCESCKTKFRLDPDRLKGPQSKVRCKKCKSVFQVTKPEEDDKVIINLDAVEDTIPEQDGLDPAPSSAEPFVPPKTRKKSRLRPIALLLCALVVVVGGFVLAEKFWLTKPASSVDDVASKVEEPTLTIPSTTQAFFVENSHVGQIFVVQGEVVNEGPKPVSFVLLEGKVYSTNNQVAQSQKSFCGNPMTREELASLGIVDIQNRMMNREGKDLSNVHIAPKGRVPFMVVFHNLPEFDQLSDYSVEVVSSQLD